VLGCLLHHRIHNSQGLKVGEGVGEGVGTGVGDGVGDGVGEGVGDEPPQEEGSEIPVPPSTALQFIEVVTSVKEVHSGNFCPFGTKARIVFPSTKRNCRRFDPALFLMTNLSPSSHPELLLTAFKSIHSQSFPV